MTEIADRPPTQEPAPTERAPEYGQIGWFDVVISEVEHWVEDGDFVFRSLEFDVIAGDPDLLRAVSKFVDNASDFRDYLDGLGDRGENEDEMLRLLNSRFSRVARELERQERMRRERFISVSLRRRGGRGDHSRVWRPQSTQQRSSSRPSPA
jgi:hypothetical protein